MIEELRPSKIGVLEDERDWTQSHASRKKEYVQSSGNFLGKLILEPKNTYSQPLFT